EEMPELKNSKEIIKTPEKSTQESAFVAKDDVLNENPQKVEAEKAVETSDISKEAVSKPVEMKVVKETSKLATEDVEVIQPQQTNLNKDVVVIKVGDVAQPESQQMFAEDLSEAIISKINSNIEQFNITLNPKDLGKIDVNIVVRSGVITVSLLCDNDTTKKLLTENLSSLTRNIEINTGQQAVVNIEKEDNSEALKYQDFDGRGNNSQQQQQERRNSEEKDVEDFIQKLKLGLVNFVEMEG
ncbi:MAG: flagellar hook-length control protein FliK, partial [Anaerotignaceae bacterium]